MSIGLYIVLAPLYLKSVRKLQEKRFVFVKILAIIIPENGAKVSKIKCFQFAQQTLFMIACAAILAIQQLSEATDNVERYKLLKKLGVEHRELNRALFIQILSYYLLPLLLAVIHSVVGLTVASREVIKVFGDMNVASTILVTSIFIVFVYGSYFLLTYVGSKSVINKG